MKNILPAAAMLALFILIISAPSTALAFDPKKGLTDTRDLAKVGLIIVMVVSAITAFLKHQLAVTIGVVVIGSIIYAATTPGVPEKIGSGLLKLVGGE